MGSRGDSPPSHRIFWNVVRLVFDRDTHVLEAMEILEGIDTLRTSELLKEAVLQDADDA